MAAFVWKLSVAFLVVSMIPMLTVRADEGDDDYCNTCTILVDDFSEELNGTAAQDLFERLCIDLLIDDGDEYVIDYCLEETDELFGTIRWLLQNGFDSEDTCLVLGACEGSEPEQKAKFAKIRQNHPLFKAQFQKLVAKSLLNAKKFRASKNLKTAKTLKNLKNLEALKNLKASKTVEGSKPIPKN